MSPWEPGGARLSACTLQLLESSQGREKGESLGALWASFAGKLQDVACAAERLLDSLSRCREGVVVAVALIRQPPAGHIVMRHVLG